MKKLMIDFLELILKMLFLAAFILGVLDRDIFLIVGTGMLMIFMELEKICERLEEGKKYIERNKDMQEH